MGKQLSHFACLGPVLARLSQLEDELPRPLPIEWAKVQAIPGWGGGCSPYDGLYREAPPERGIFFRLQVYERVGISLAEVYERVGKSVIVASKKASKGPTCAFHVSYGCEKVENKL